ncbi:MAG: hypothetical protein EOM50_06840, partial [Erysipelotrichia bacterium]|nr:hypothetical protein [Erysipelotrichia bacterium]
MASHKSKRLKRNIVFLYLSLLVAILTFFTVYAYRFDVLSQLHENNYVDFSVSEVKQKAIEQQFYKYEFNNENMSHFKEILENELVDYTITISYFSVDDEESDLYYAYGRGPYEENTKYAQDFNINSDGKEITIVAYPTFRRYFTYYRTFAFVIALVCGSVCFLLLYRGKIAERIVNLWKKMKKKYEYRLLQKLSIKMIVANIFAIIIAFSLYTFIYTNRYSFFEFVSDTFYLRQDFSEEVS